MASTWTEGEHRSGAARIHYWRTGGAGKRPLVLVHGFTDNGLCWGPVARELEDEYDIIMPDMVGHGLSSRAAEIAGVDMAGDLISLVEGLGLERPAIVGHSMGAMVAAQAAGSRPALARAVALEDPPWFPLSAALFPMGEDSPIAAWAKTLHVRKFDDLLGEYRRGNPAWPEDFLRAMCEAKLQLDPDIVEALDAALKASGSNWVPILRAIDAPLLIVAGDSARGAIVGEESLALIRAEKPGTEIARIPGVGHLIRFDAPAAYMRALRAFLVSRE